MKGDCSKKSTVWDWEYISYIAVNLTVDCGLFSSLISSVSVYSWWRFTRRGKRHWGLILPLTSFIITSKKWRTLFLFKDLGFVSMGFPLYVPKFFGFNVSSSSSRHERQNGGKADATCRHVQRVSSMLQLVKVRTSSSLLAIYWLSLRELCKLNKLEIIFFVSVVKRGSDCAK